MGLLNWLFGSLVRAKLVVDANADDGDNDDIVWEDEGRGRTKYFLADYPDDEVYLDTAVVGTSFRQQDVLKWAVGRRLSLDWQREPNNEHDWNALMIFGLSAQARAHLGYAPKEIAAQIVKSGLIEKLQPRLTRIYQGPSDDGDNLFRIEFEVTGPRELKDQFLKKPKKRAAPKNAAEKDSRSP